MNLEISAEEKSLLEHIKTELADIGKDRSKLIPILQFIQEKLAYLPGEALNVVAEHLKISPSDVYGVATFYNQFRLEPNGKNHIQVCRGTACHVLGSATVLEEMEKQLRIKAGQTSKDGQFSIEVVACIGACGLAPVICVNGNFHAKVDANELKEIFNQYRNQEESND